MKVISTEKLNNIRVQATIEIPESEFEASLDKAYRIVVKKVNIPGFRKGKAPRQILERMYGREILLEDALQDAVPKAFDAALEELKEQYICVSQPEYEILETEKGKPVLFKASFDIKPEVKLGDYKGIELEKKVYTVKPEDVDAEIEKMRQRYAKLVLADGLAQNGDVLTIDFLGKVDGQAFPGGQGENYPLELGSGTFIPGFEEQLVGTIKDQTLDINVKFPEDYHNKDLAGQDAVFTVTVKEIKRKEYAPLDDEFAKDVSEFETLQELRTDIENNLKEARKQRTEQELREEAITKVADNAEVELPESMIEDRVMRMVEDLAFRIEQQGIPFNYYLKVTNTDLATLQSNSRPAAERSVKADLVLEAIAKAENIQVEAADVDKELEKLAEMYKQDVAKIRESFEKQGQISALEYSIMIDKAVDLIIREANITEKTLED